jgi:hypothetical protein
LSEKADTSQNQIFRRSAKIEDSPVWAGQVRFRNQPGCGQYCRPAIGDEQPNPVSHHLIAISVVINARIPMAATLGKSCPGVAERGTTGASSGEVHDVILY